MFWFGEAVKTHINIIVTSYKLGEVEKSSKSTKHLLDFKGRSKTNQDVTLHKLVSCRLLGGWNSSLLQKFTTSAGVLQEKPSHSQHSHQ